MQKKNEKFTMPYLKSIMKVILFALVKTVGMKQVSANRGPTSGPVDEGSIWGLISKASRARGFKLMVQAQKTWAWG